MAVEIKTMGCVSQSAVGKQSNEADQAHDQSNPPEILRRE
jgi:hypothetical protein